MSEIYQNQEVQFKTIQEYVAHLKESGAETVSVQEVVDTITAITNRPRGVGARRRGSLAGLSLEEMTIEQLKREKINASSVLYKAKKRGASEETIARNQARLDAVLAELEKRKALEGAQEVGDEAGEAGDAGEVIEELIEEL